jgi:hypothetical protein
MTVSMLVALIVINGLHLVAPSPSAHSAYRANLLRNGNFEDGFVRYAECGIVAAGWHCFSNADAGTYSFQDERWAPAVADGEHSQLIRLGTNGSDQSGPVRFAGIYQSVQVVPGEPYTLHLNGLIRTNMPDGFSRYRPVQVGWTPGIKADWSAVDNWQDVAWSTRYGSTTPGAFNSSTATIIPEDRFITVYIRVWPRSDRPAEEIDVNLDAIALVGPSPTYQGDYPDQALADAAGDMPPAYAPPITEPVADAFLPTAVSSVPVACSGSDQIANGGFDRGFNPISLHHVGKSWGYFNNGGAANYGYYADDRNLAMPNDDAGQIITIDVRGAIPAATDRYTGIYQQIRGLTPGTVYELSVAGLMWGADGEGAPHRIEAQWGYTVGDDTDWRNVVNWSSMDLGPLRTMAEAGHPDLYVAHVVAPETDVVLFVRGWLKQPESGTTMALALKEIGLHSCEDGFEAPERVASQKAPATHVVQPGETLSDIAITYGVGVEDLAATNGLTDMNFLYVGQVLTIS